LNPAAIFSHLSFPILKKNFRFRRDSISELKVSKGLLNQWQKCESQVPTAK